MVVNSPGLIDSGYRGEVRVCLYNSGPEPFAVEVGERIAQLVIQRVEEPVFREVRGSAQQAGAKAVLAAPEASTC